jgi:opacity protein-like surface antigen
MKGVIHFCSNSAKLIIVSALISVLFLPTLIMAQDHRIEITPFAGFQLGGSFKFYEGKLKVVDNADYGGMISVLLGSGTQLEFAYSRMDTRAEWRPYNDYDLEFPQEEVDLAVNYFLLGGVKELDTDNEAVRPFGLFSLGATWFDPKDDNTTDKWLFSMAAGVGLKYFFNERIGIRIQARLLMPMVWNGMTFYVGVGSGGASSGVGVTSTSSIVQGDFTGGLIIALGDL